MNTEKTVDFLGGLLQELEEAYDSGYECEHTHKITEEFLSVCFNDNATKMREAMKWLLDHGGGCCDCEIVINIAKTEQGILSEMWGLVSRNSKKAVLVEKLFCLAEEDRHCV